MQFYDFDIYLIFDFITSLLGFPPFTNSCYYINHKNSIIHINILQYDYIKNAYFYNLIDTKEIYIVYIKNTLVFSLDNSYKTIMAKFTYAQYI